MEKNNISKNKKKPSSGFSWKKNISALALASVLIFSPGKSKAQNTKVIQDNKQNLIENINTSIGLDTMEMKVLLEWFEYNTFIKVNIIPRTEYQKLKESFIKKDNKEILYIPEDIGIQEFEDIIRYLNQKTFGGNVPQHAAFYKIKALKKDNKNGYYQNLLESIFEYGIDSLSNINNLKNTFISENKGLEEKLQEAKKKENKKEITKIQKEIIGNVVSHIHNFGRNKQNDNSLDTDIRNEKGTPTSAINKNISNCITKSVMIYKILEYYQIQYRGCYSPGHQSIKVKLNDGSLYYLDAEKFDHILPRKEDNTKNTPLYKNIKTPNGQINTITQDAELQIIANMLYNKALVLHEQAKKEKDETIKSNLFQKAHFYLQKAQGFSDSIPLFRKLGAEICYYEGKDTKNTSRQNLLYEKAINYIKQATNLDGNNVGSWELEGEIYKKMGKTKESEEAYKKFQELMSKPIR